jgi:hypothetical protein
MLKTKKDIRYNFRNLYPHKKARDLASDADKINRNLLIYKLWQSGQLTNQQWVKSLA